MDQKVAANRVLVFQLRAERKAGGWLDKYGPTQGGDRKSKSQDATLKLEDLEIDASESSRWQLQARLPKVDGIAELLSVHRNSVLNWTKDLREGERREQDRKIWDMWLACATQEEIGKAVGLTQQAIAVRITKITESPEIGNPDPLCVYNVWNFSRWEWEKAPCKTGSTLYTKMCKPCFPTALVVYTNLWKLLPMREETAMLQDTTAIPDA